MAERIILEEKANKIVYRDGDTIVKAYTAAHPKHLVYNEAFVHSCVEMSGLNVPKVLGVREENGGWALTLTYIEGTTLEQLMRENPQKRDEYLEKLVDIQLEIGSHKAPRLRNTIYKMEETINALEDIDPVTRYELLQRLHGMKRHTKLCHGDLVPSNVIIREDGSWYVLDWSHATQGNAGADAAITYLQFALDDPEMADRYQEIFSDKAGMPLKYLQTWLPIVAAARLAMHRENEKEFLERWISVAEYQ